MSFVFPFTRFIAPQDQICLAREEIMGYAGSITRKTYIDDVVVFGIPLAVRSPPQQSASFLKR